MSRQRSGRTGENKIVTVIYPEFELEVHGYYIEGEKSERDYPGYPSDLEIEKVVLSKGEVIDLINEGLNHDELVNKAIEQIESEL
jgi:hypothetical protein